MMTTFYYHTEPMGFLSQFYECEFYENGVKFYSAEQYMMYKKAVLFNDGETALEILYAENPSDCKKLGMKVKQFDQNLWDSVKTKIVYKGNLLKFSQSESLASMLLATFGDELVQTSPEDSVWGNGLSFNDTVMTPIHLWPGQNLLGKILVNVRTALS